ncbi:MAG: putative lipid II flippase FtsW [Spirochaetes bacterium]|nr:putative lipid II flippase FtsW [Spirochaetota bacterium]
MYQFDEDKAYNSRIVHLLCACTLLLTGVGLVTLYSSSYWFAERVFMNRYHFVIRQSIFAGVGLALFFAASVINLEVLRRLVMPLVFIAAALCALTLVPGIGVELHGAARWIQIGGNTYQPSEMVKFVLPLYLAHIFDKKKDSINSFVTGVLPPMLIIGLFFALIYLQNNFSTATFVTLNALILFFLAGLKYSYFISAVIIFLPISTLLLFTAEHRVRRFASFLRPEWDPLGAGFQVNASRLTMVSGGLWGTGIGQGTRKVASVPEVHSDFIFAAFAEEAGFFGVLLFFALFAAFAFLGYRAAARAPSAFKFLLAAGLTTIIVTQALLNIAVTSGTLPATGVPLPFFSAGGSSILTTLVCAGLIVNVARSGVLKTNAAEELNEKFGFTGGSGGLGRGLNGGYSALEGQDVR